MLRGGLDVLEDAGARLAGGHSAEGPELALGFTITGDVAADRILRKGGLNPGDRLILTKPLGTGVLLAAAMRGDAKARWIVAALAAMGQASGPAAGCLIEHGATACTDVTGFGLLGHLAEMAWGSDIDVRIDPARIAALDGALEMLKAGIRSTLHSSNAEICYLVDGQVPDLLLDPQTAGGLLSGVPVDKADACLEALRALGYAKATVIGIVEPMEGAEPTIRLGNLPQLDTARRE
jgi:selenide,water dikinase